MVSRAFGRLVRRCGVGMGVSVFLKQDFVNIMVLGAWGGGAGHGAEKLLGSYMEMVNEEFLFPALGEKV